ncbi:MAG TPA: carbohydrate binding domain-containing protein [Bryobacteraceae bacterium]|nr:carbohydrate binding domain-containing protein [Bryobacteraceae bacterium]
MIDTGLALLRLSAAVMLAGQGGALAVSATSVTLINPGFESPYFGLSGNSQITGVIATGWSDNSAWSNSTVQYAQEFNNPHSGATCQKMTVAAVPNGEAQFLQSIPVVAGSLYTASVWMRGAPGTQVILRIQDGSAPYESYLDTYTNLSSNWQEVTIQGYIVVNANAYLMVALRTPGTVWMDDASVSYTTGGAPPTPKLGPIPTSFFGIHVANYLQSALSNAGFEPPFVSAGQNNPISGNIAYGWNDNSSWAKVTVTYSEDTASPHGGTSAQMVNVQAVQSGAVQLTQGVTVIPGAKYTFSVWLRGQPGMTVNVILQDQNAPYAYYALTAAALTASWQRFSVTGQVEDTGAVLLMIQASTPGTFSADDVSFTDANGQPVSGGVPWPVARFGTLRLWDSGTAWTALEPLRGVWNFAPLDTWVAAAEANGIPDIILTLGQTPAWASSNPDDVNYVGAGAPAPPNSIQDWRDYITAVAQRYQGRIRYYEVWNEPNDNTYFTGTVAQLAQLTQEAYQIIKSVDPNNTVISPAAYSAGYLDTFLATGAGQYADVIGHHFYTTPPEATGAQIANVRLVMNKYGMSSKPLWDTEGASGDTTTPPDQAAAYIVRKYLTDLAYGAARYDWYTWGRATSFCVGAEQNDPRALTEAGQAYRYMFDWLLGASLSGAAMDASGTWQIGLTLATGDAAVIVWNPAGSAQFAIPSAIQARTVRDIFGGATPVTGTSITVTDSPVLVSSCCQTTPTVNGVTNAASFTGAVSPGSLASIFGAGFAAQRAEAGSLPLADDLGNVSVTVDGVYGPMLYADSGQINFQVPFEAQAGSATLVVRSPAGISLEYPLTIGSAAPGIFLYDTNRAVATDPHGTLLTAANPAPAGSVIVVYLTGIGSLTVTPLDGVGAPAATLARAVLPFSATIGGVDAPIQFLGLTPYFVGLAQANIQVPQLAAGEYPLVITVDGVASAAAQLSVSQ